MFIRVWFILVLLYGLVGLVRCVKVGLGLLEFGLVWLLAC